MTTAKSGVVQLKRTGGKFIKPYTRKIFEKKKKGNGRRNDRSKGGGQNIEEKTCRRSEKLGGG